MNKEDFIKKLEEGYKSLTREETLEEKSFRAGYEYAVDKMFYTITNLQEENERLKENNMNMQIEMSKCWEKIDKAIEYIYSHYDLGTKENVEFCILRDRVLQILKGDTYNVIEILRGEE